MITCTAAALRAITALLSPSGLKINISASDLVQEIYLIRIKIP